MNNFGYIIWCLLMLGGVPAACAQDGRAVKNAPAASLTDGAWYVFRPEIVYPASGSSRQLSSGFELRFSKDSIFCYLPYFGRVYNAPYGGRDAPLDFSTSDFDLQRAAKQQEQVWVLKPRQQREIDEIRITVYKDGYAYVQVAFKQRQNIAYRGQISRE